MEDAIGIAGRLVEIEPENVPVLLMRANLNYVSEHYADVVADCDRVITLEPTNAMAYFLQGKAKKAAGDPLGAIVGLSQAIN